MSSRFNSVTRQLIVYVQQSFDAQTPVLGTVAAFKVPKPVYPICVETPRSGRGHTCDDQSIACRIRGKALGRRNYDGLRTEGNQPA